MDGMATPRKAMGSSHTAMRTASRRMRAEGGVASN